MTENMEIEVNEGAKTMAAEFRVDRNQLKKAIQRAMKTIGSSKSESPVLSSIYMNLEGDELTVYSTDMKSALSTGIEVMGEKDGFAILPGRVFNDIINAIPKGEEDDTILIAWDDVGNTTINAPGYKYKITAIRADYQEYIMKIEDGVTFDISGTMLNDMVSMVTPAIGADDYRPGLMVGRLELDGDKIRMIGTDSRRLVVIERTLEGVDERINAHILGKGLKELNGIIDGSEIITVVIDNKGSLASFTTGQSTFYIRLMDTTYPEWQSIIPSESTIEVDVEGKKLLEAIEGVMPMAKNINNTINMLIKDDKIKIASDGDEQGEAVVELDALAHKGGKLDISFNGRYIQEAIKGVSHLTLRLSFTKNLAPMIIRQVDSSSNFTWIVMPIRPA